MADTTSLEQLRSAVRAKWLAELTRKQGQRWRTSQGQVDNEVTLRQQVADQFAGEQAVIDAMNRDELTTFDRALDTGDKRTQAMAFTAVIRRLAGEPTNSPAPPSADGREH